MANFPLPAKLKKCAICHGNTGTQGAAPVGTNKEVTFVHLIFKGGYQVRCPPLQSWAYSSGCGIPVYEYMSLWNSCHTKKKH